MKIETKLARVFGTLAQVEQKTESTAAGIFDIVKAGKVRTVKRWDELVQAAYEANGWNSRPGRPAADAEKKDEVPGTVRTYATIVRQALRARLKILDYKSFTALRADLARQTTGSSHRVKAREAPAANDPQIPDTLAADFIGVGLQEVSAPNGALFHDLGAVYVGLPEEHRDVFSRQLQKLLNKYMPLAKMPKLLTAPKGRQAREKKAA